MSSWDVIGEVAAAPEGGSWTIQRSASAVCFAGKGRWGDQSGGSSLGKIWVPIEQHCVMRGAVSIEGVPGVLPTAVQLSRHYNPPSAMVIALATLHRIKYDLFATMSLLTEIVLLLGVAAMRWRWEWMPGKAWARPVSQ